MEDEARASEARFVGYVESLAEVLGYVDRAGPLKDYCTGLLLPGERKSVEPIASIVAPWRVSAEHQSLLHFVGQSAWSDEIRVGRDAPDGSRGRGLVRSQSVGCVPDVRSNRAWRLAWRLPASVATK